MFMSNTLFGVVNEEYERFKTCPKLFVTSHGHIAELTIITQFHTIHCLDIKPIIVTSFHNPNLRKTRLLVLLSQGDSLNTYTSSTSRDSECGKNSTQFDAFGLDGCDHETIVQRLILICHDDEGFADRIACYVIF